MSKYLVTNALMLFLLPAALLFCTQHALSTELSHTKAADLLEQAYSLRSSDSQESGAILNSISRASLNEVQQDRYDFLNAYLLFMKGSIAPAIEAFENLSQNAHTFTERFNAYAALGSLYAGTQNWSQGLKTIDYLSENINLVNNKQSEEQAHSAVINLYGQMNEVVPLIEYAEPLLDDGYSPRFTCFTTMQMLSAQLDAKTFDLAKQDFTAAMDTCESAGEPLATLNLYNLLANFWLSQNKAEEALDTLLEKSEEIRQSTYPPLVDDHHMFLSQAYYELGDYENALKYASIIVKDKLPTELVSKADVVGYQIMFEVAETNKNFEQALLHYKRYMQAKSRNISSENAKMLAIQKAKLDSVQKTQQIELLNAENTLLKTRAALDDETSRNRTLLIITMLMALLFIAIWLYKKHTTYLKLQEIARKDALTGIANRLYFTTNAKQAISRCEENKVSVSLVFFDIDDFKLINDTFGHAVGDIALQTTADITKATCRTNDLIGRLGGEEFAILLEGCGLDKALEIAEACRQAIANTNSSPSQDFTLRASFGVSCSDTSSYGFENLFDVADKALYQAKRNGKNRVEYH